MCNLSGFIGNVDDGTEMKIKILGLLGRARGTDSTGIVINGDLTKKAGNYNADAIDFFQEYDYKVPERSTDVILTHNRAGSAGYARTVTTAQPFNYNDQMFFMHNGTITNASAICKEYNLDPKEYVSDSHVFGQLIYQGVNLEELFPKYQGAAVFIWWWTDEDVINVFKGSCEKSFGKNKEERPLSIVKADNGYYFSSLKEQLNVISKEDIVSFPVNQIIEVDPNLDIEDFNYTLINRKVLKPYNNYATPYVRPFADEVKYHSHVCTFYKNNYYMGEIPMHGVFKLDRRGMLCDMSVSYYFHNGMLLKDRQTYEAIKAGKEVFMTDLHSRCVSRSSEGNYFWWNRPVKSQKISDPIFNLRDYEFKNGSIAKTTLARTFPNTQQIYGNLSTTQILKNFNDVYDAGVFTWNDMRSHYAKMNDLKVTEVVDTFYRDLQGIYSGITQLVNNPYTDLYNDMMQTKFHTLFQCINNWFNMCNEAYPDYDDYINFYETLDNASINV